MIKRALIAILLALFASTAHAQGGPGPPPSPWRVNGATINPGSYKVFVNPSASVAGFNIPPGTTPLSLVNGDLWVTSSGIYARVNGATVGPFGASGGLPGGAQNDVQYQGPAGTFAGITVGDGQILIGQTGTHPSSLAISGDCSLADTGAITCGKTGGVSFGYFATGTDASNLTGTVNTARLPSPFTNGTISGTGSKFLTITGTLVNGNCISVDASLNGVDSGAPCGGGTGSGTVNAGTANQLAYYAGAGTAVSGLATANNGVLITDGSGVPSISSTLPAAVQANITNVGSLTNLTATGTITTGITGSTQCLHVNSSGVVSGAGADCGSGGGTPGGSNTNVQFNNSSAFGGSAAFTWNGTGVTVGASGTLGYLQLGNATSGLVRIQPVTGSLGTPIILIPAANDTLVAQNTSDTLTNKTISGSSNTLSNIANASLTNSSITIAGHSVSLGGTQAISASDLSNGVTGTGGTPVVLQTSPTLITPALGVATATSLNGLTVTTTTGTFTLASGKTFAVDKSLELDGTDSTKMTFPGVSATIAALNIEDQTLSGGANVTVKALSTGPITVDCGARPQQYIANTGAFTITAPAADGSCYVQVENGVGAGAVTFSGFNVSSNIGDPLTTTNGDKFLLVISRTHSVSTYSVKALQGTGALSSLVVGSTTIGSGTDTYLLYNNAGVLGNESLASLLASPPTIGGTTPGVGDFSSVNIATLSPYTAAVQTIAGSVYMSQTDPTMVVAVPSFDTGDTGTAQFNIITTYSASVPDTSFRAQAIINSGTTAGGSGGAIYGGVLVQDAGHDPFGVLGVVRNIIGGTLTTPYGAAGFFISRGDVATGGGTSNVDIARIVAENTDGQHARAALYIYSSTALNAPDKGIIIANSMTTGLEMGGSGLVIPTNFAAFYNTSGTKVFGISGAGAATATSFIPTSATVPVNGMYLVAANSVGIATNSTNAVYIDSTQHVGIGGTSIAGVFLNIVGSSTVDPMQISNASTTGFAQMKIVASAQTFQFGVGGASASLGVASSFFIYDTNNSAMRIIMDTTGNFAIQQTLSVKAIAADTGHTDATVCEDTTSHTFYSGTGTLGICLGTSGRQFKTAFAPMTAGLDQIMALPLMNYRYRPGYGDGGTREQYGLVAQDVAMVMPDLVGRDSNGDIINYDAGALLFVSMRAIQQLKADNDNLHQEIKELKRAHK